MIHPAKRGVNLAGLNTYWPEEVYTLCTNLNVPRVLVFVSSSDLVCQKYHLQVWLVSTQSVLVSTATTLPHRADLAPSAKVGPLCGLGSLAQAVQCLRVSVVTTQGGQTDKPDALCSAAVPRAFLRQPALRMAVVEAQLAQECRALEAVETAPVLSPGSPRRLGRQPLARQHSCRTSCCLTSEVLLPVQFKARLFSAEAERLCGSAGMHCAGCTRRVKRLLEAEDGVLKVAISFALVWPLFAAVN